MSELSDVKDELSEVKTQMALLNQKLSLLIKHDNCLYGPTGEGGVVRDMNILRAVVYCLTLLVGGSGAACSLHFVFKVF